MDEKTVLAHSIGSRAAIALRSEGGGRVLASFDRVCDLVTDDGAVIALGWSGVERGPLTVLLAPIRDGAPWSRLRRNAEFRASPRQILLRGDGCPPVRVDLSGAAHWEAALGWKELRARRRAILASSEIVARAESQARAMDAAPRWKGPLAQATAELRASFFQRNRDGLRAAIRRLCGLGEGLTPQGDDWLAGWLLALRLADPPDADGWGVEALGGIVLDAAVTRTTLLSRAFLACAAAGESSERWHQLLRSMAENPTNEREIQRSTRSVLSQGATSGAAMLQGFLDGLCLTAASRILRA